MISETASKFSSGAGTGSSIGCGCASNGTRGDVDAISGESTVEVPTILLRSGNSMDGNDGNTTNPSTNRFCANEKKPAIATNKPRPAISFGLGEYGAIILAT